MSADRIVGIVLLAIVGVYAYLIIQLPAQRMPDDVGEALVPWLITGASVLLCAALLLAPGGGPDASHPAEENDAEGPPSFLSHGILTVAAMAAYIFLLPYAGFFISTSVFALGLMHIGGSRYAGRDIAIAVVATLVIQITFTRLLLVPLPTGNWLDWIEWW